LNISREGDSTASLGSLGQGSITLRGKKFFLMFSWNFLCFSLCPVPLVLSLGSTEKSLASASRVMTALVKKKRRVIVIGDSLLRGEEGLICQPGPPHRAVCCLPGAWVRDVARKLPGLVWPSDYYLLLVMQVGGDEIEERSPKGHQKGLQGTGAIS